MLRLSRWTVEVDNAGTPTGLADEFTVLETSADSDVHGMATVIADEDGTLWVSVGDSSGFLSVDQRALRTLDINDAYGKVLHVKADGTGVPGNPYYNASNPTRQPARCTRAGSAARSGSASTRDKGQPVVGDVGWNAWEEVDV